MNAVRLEEYLLHPETGTQDRRIGGFRKTPEESFADLLHSYFGVCGLALVEHSGVKPLDASLGVASDLGTNLLPGGTGVDLSELSRIELGGLEDLHLPDVDVLQRVDALACLLDVLAEGTLPPKRDCRSEQAAERKRVGKTCSIRRGSRRCGRRA